MRFRALSLAVAALFAATVPAARAATPCPLSTVSPSVTICAPTNGSTVTSPFQVWAGTTDSAHPVTAMKVYLDTVAVYSGSSNVVNTSLSAAAGSHRLTVNAWDSSGTVFKSTINFTVGSGGSVTVSPANVGFGNQTVNTMSAPMSVTLTNGTASAITVSTPAISGDFLISSNSCGSSLAANSNCVVGVVFQPTATGTRTGTLTITDSPDSGSPHVIGLSGSGVSATTCTPSTVSLSVTICTPANGATVASPFQVTAVTTDTAHPVTAMKVYLDSVAIYTVNAAQLSTTVTAAAGAHNLTINAWDSTGAVFKGTSLITVSAAPPAPSVTPASLTFSSQLLNTTSAAQNVTLTNPTTSAITVSTPTITGDFQISNNGCGASLAANANCVIQVSFQPSALGTRTGALTVTDSPDSGSPHTVNLTGTGADALSATPAALAFGDQAINLTSPPQSVKLTNNSSATLTLSLATAAPYAESDNCNGTLSAGASCTATLTFTPTTTGAHNGNLTITYNAGGSPLGVPLTGAGVTTSSIAVTPANPSIAIQATRQFTATATYSDNTTADVTPQASWSSSDSTVATISNQGLATGVNAGSSTIQASYAGVNGSTTLTVSAAATFDGVLTFHNDNLRTGANTSETTLTPANVNATNFGKLFSYTVDGRIYAQPLYVPNVNVNGTTHNVVYVVTENDSVYAYDADTLAAGPLWKRNFLNSTAGITTVSSSTVGSNVTPQIGITGTPVIDPSSDTLYCVAATTENGVYHWRLHALDIGSGADKFGGSVDVTASGFLPEYHLQRPGLLLANGNVYFAFGSNGDHNTWHGWVFAYDAKTLLPVGVYNATPSGNGGGIWMGAGGLGADATGNVYFETGNGTNNISTGGASLSDSFLKLNASAQRLDYFTPYDHTNLDCCDLDMASGGPVLLPDQSGSFPHIMIGGGKTGVLYVINRDNMGQFNGTSNNIIQTLSGALGGGLYSQPSFWNGRMYISPNVATLKAFSITSGKLSTSADMQTSVSFTFPGGNVSISADGTSNGIVWAQNFNSSGTILYAFDANNLSSILWNSNQNATRDSVGTGEKFMAPTVANGKVYIGTTSKLIVYGLLH